MKDKDNASPRIGFNEALTRIANTPKSAIVKRHENIDIEQEKTYIDAVGTTKSRPKPDKIRP